MGFEHIDHTADIAIRVTAASPAALFAEATRAVFSVLIAPESAPVQRRDAIAVDLKAPDGESLLVEYLNELVYLFDARRFVVVHAAIECATFGPEASLKGVLEGETFDRRRHVASTEIKAATYHELEIRKCASGLSVSIVFDL